MDDQFIVDLANEIYDGHGSLALSAFNEKIFLTDAKDKIRTLRHELAVRERALEMLNKSGLNCTVCFKLAYSDWICATCPLSANSTIVEAVVDRARAEIEKEDSK